MEKYLSGVAKEEEGGLDICWLAMVYIVNNTVLHLNVWQTSFAI